VSSTDESVIILDFGAQYTQLIARRIRECGVYCEIEPYTLAHEDILQKAPKGIVLSGGPASVYEDGAPTIGPRLFELGIPVLGICYGHQLMAHVLGGDVRGSAQREYGPAMIEVTEPDVILADVRSGMQCWMSHGDTVQTPPRGFAVLARTATTPVAAMADVERRLYGVQFHPEVVHTTFGKDVLRRFVMDVCGCQGLWSAGSFVDEAIADIRNRVGDSGVVCGVSGGVDSCTVAALVHRAVGDQLTCVFVDHGLLRLGEREQVEQEFAAALGIRLISVDARERFLSRLRGVVEPEMKRKIIGEEFVRVFEDCARSIQGATFLAQGTLYPDVIESGTATAATIKSHHNVGGLPEVMGLKVLEPLRFLFKDEVREVATALGLPEDIVWRHPFPGPGLAIRITGAVTDELLESLRLADAIFIEELKRHGLYRETWQAFAAMAPGTRSVGVMGDARTYSCPVILRAVTSEDGMTADWARLPHEFLQIVAARIANEVPGVNRVVYDISSKPPATIEWE
jgi:GMP synthase (glutamine-hydrolysing)